VILGLPALAFLLDPRNRPARENDFKTVARLTDLPLGKPRQVVIRDLCRDAWTVHPDDVIGRVWLVRRADDQIDAFTSTCPHLGCSINFAEKEKLFLCPCHGGTFDLDGHRVEKPNTANPAPRGMDRLVCRRDPGKPDLIQVKYQNFIQGKDTPIPKT
jgi:Rieske Fe-S protein